MMRMRTPIAVRGFLIEHPRVVKLLREIPRRVEQYFGESQIVLDVRIYLGTSEPLTLFIYVVTCLSPDEVMSRWMEFEEQWWSGASEDYPVHFHVEFAQDAGTGQSRGGGNDPALVLATDAGYEMDVDLNVLQRISDKAREAGDFDHYIPEDDDL